MPSGTTVVHLRRKNGAVVVDCDVYIGRAQYQGGWRLPGSKWANPFKLAGNSPAARREALAKYETYVGGSPELMAALPELRGKRLGCWCKPLACHGDVLVALLAEGAPAPVAEGAVEAATVALAQLLASDVSLSALLGTLR